MCEKQEKRMDYRTVEPIRDLDKLSKMKDFLYIKNRRDWCLFIIGINSGLRIGDLLKLTVEEVRNADKLVIKEQKTGKIKKFDLSDTIKDAINDYLSYSKLESGLLFPSRTGNKAVTKCQIWRSLNAAAEFAGVTENVGTHSMRKTAAYWALRNGTDISYIMQAFNHSSPAITKRYIGITEDEVNKEFYGNINL